jgi:hypothetical protein
MWCCCADASSLHRVVFQGNVSHVRTVLQVHESKCSSRAAFHGPMCCRALWHRPERGLRGAETLIPATCLFFFISLATWFFGQTLPKGCANNSFLPTACLRVHSPARYSTAFGFDVHSAKDQRGTSGVFRSPQCTCALYGNSVITCQYRATVPFVSGC